MLASPAATAIWVPVLPPVPLAVPTVAPLPNLSLGAAAAEPTVAGTAAEPAPADGEGAVVWQSAQPLLSRRAPLEACAPGRREAAALCRQPRRAARAAAGCPRADPCPEPRRSRQTVLLPVKLGGPRYGRLTRRSLRLL